MCQHPKLTCINLSLRVFSPPLLCSYLTQANLLLPFLRHRSINLFLLAYQRIWIETEEYSFEEKLVQDLAVSTCVIPQCPLVVTHVLWGAERRPYSTTFLYLSSLKVRQFHHTHWLAFSHPYDVSQPHTHNHFWQAWHHRWCQSQPVYFDHQVPSNIGKRASSLDASPYQWNFRKL